MIRLKERRIRSKRTGSGFVRSGLKKIGRSATIRVKLIIAFFVPIIFIITLGLVSFDRAAKGIRSSYENSTRQAISMTSKYLLLGIDSIEAEATQLLNDKGVVKYLSGQYGDNLTDKNNTLKNIKNTIRIKVTTDDFISQIFVLTDKEKSLTTASSVKNTICTEFYATDLGKSFAGVNNSAWVGQNSFLDKELGIGPDYYALRLIRSDAYTGSLLIYDLDNNSILDILKNMNFNKAGIIGLVTKDGKEIFPDSKEKKTVFSDQNFYKSATTSDKADGYDYVTYQGKSNLFMYSKIGDTGAMICAMIPKSTILSQADSIKQITVIIVIIACIVAVLIGFVISFGIDKTIRNIIAKLKKAADGDLTVDFSTKRKDEFRILIDEINHTFTNMKKLISQVKILSSDVSKASESVSNTSEEFVKTTGDISAAMNGIEQGIMQQAKDAEECLLQMDNLSGKITLMSDNTCEISRIAQRTKDSIKEGTIATKELNEQTISTKKITTDIVNGIEELAEKSKSIDSIINVISEISNQTNLLSLNASIEAARAGEAGKGFAIVAGEIGKLAEQTKSSVNNIKNIINSIQNNTKNVALTAKQAEDVMVLQDNAVNNTTASYQNINESVDQLMVHLNQIVENVNNMEEARESTLGAIENISAVLEEIAASTNSVNQISGSQLNSVENLNVSADTLNHNSEQLVVEIHKFTV